MAVENKTIATKISWKKFLETKNFSDEDKKQATQLVTLFENATKSKCVMWGEIFGFGKYHYVSPSKTSKREGDWMASSFALRKAGIMVYLVMGCNNYLSIIKDLGTSKVSGKSCLEIKNLNKIHLPVLEKLIKANLFDLSKKYTVIK